MDSDIVGGVGMSRDTVSLPFHRKYRPTKLSEYIGNDRAKEKALARLRSGNIPQIWLLKGASGCGKTSFARLIAKEVRCENREELGHSCGECPSCKEIEHYIETGSTDELTDLREIDMSSKNGINEVGEILEEAMYPSLMGTWKIYIFDECHMATKQAQNRMLKIAEEPPEKVMIIFCTTNPEEMLPTLLNRCQVQLDIHKPTLHDLSGLLRSVCLQEGAEFDIKGLNLIANRTELTIRNSLTTLEQILTEKGSAKYTDVVSALDEVADEMMFKFYKCLLNRDIQGYITLIHQIKSKIELKVFVNSLIEFTTKGIYVANSLGLEGLTDGEMKAYKDIFLRFSISELATLLSKLLDLKGRSIETKLLLLGYSGLRGNTVDNTNRDTIEVEAQEDEIANENKASLRNSMDKYEPTEEESKNLVDNQMTGADIDDLAGLFGATIVSDN